MTNESRQQLWTLATAQSQRQVPEAWRIFVSTLKIQPAEKEEEAASEGKWYRFGLCSRMLERDGTVAIEEESGFASWMVDCRGLSRDLTVAPPASFLAEPHMFDYVLNDNKDRRREGRWCYYSVEEIDVWRKSVFDALEQRAKANHTGRKDTSETTAKLSELKRRLRALKDVMEIRAKVIGHMINKEIGDTEANFDAFENDNLGKTT